MSRTLEAVVVDELIDYIEEQARKKSGIRGLYADLMSEGNYRNKAFDEVLGFYLDSFDETAADIDPNDRMSDEEVVRRSVPAFIDGHFAFMVMSDRKLSDRLDDNSYRQMEKAALNFEDTWLRDSRGRGRRDDRRDNRSRDYDDRRDNRSRDYDRGGRDRIDPREIRSGISGSYGSSGRTGSSGAGGVKRGIHAVMDSVQQNERDDRDDRRDSRSDRREVEEVEEKVEVRAVKKPLARAIASFEGPDYTKAFPHADFMIDGERWMFTTKVPEELDRKLQPSFFDVNNKIRFVVQSDNGDLREEIVPVTEDTRYAQHELLHNAEKAANSSEHVVSLTKGFNAGQVENNELPEEETKTPLHDILGSPAVMDAMQRRSNESTILTSNLDESINQTRLRLSTIKDRVAVDYYVVRDIVVMQKSSDYSLELKKLDSAHSLADFHSKLAEVRPTLDPNVWAKINRRISALLETSLRFQWRLPSKNTFDFYAHFPDFMKAFTARNKADFVSIFHQRTKPLISLTMSRLVESELAEYLGDLVDVTSPNTTVVFVDYECVIALRKTADALGIGKQLQDRRTGVTVRALETSQLQSVFRQIYAALPYGSEMINNLRPIRLVTSDYNRVSVYTFNGRPDEFVLSQPVDTL